MGTVMAAGVRLFVPRALCCLLRASRCSRHGPKVSRPRRGSGETGAACPTHGRRKVARGQGNALPASIIHGTHGAAAHPSAYAMRDAPSLAQHVPEGWE